MWSRDRRWSWRTAGVCFGSGPFPPAPIPGVCGPTSPKHLCLTTLAGSLGLLSGPFSAARVCSLIRTSLKGYFFLTRSFTGEPNLAACLCLGKGDAFIQTLLWQQTGQRWNLCFCVSTAITMKMHQKDVDIQMLKEY